MFEPTTFPTAIPGLPSSDARTETTSSGMDVPAATMVRPTRAGATRASRASPLAPRIKASPPSTSSARPATTMRSPSAM